MPGELLERDVPLSQSLIWHAHSRHYALRGAKSWTEDMIPQFITNNPLIAEIYARLVCAFLDDCRKFAEGTPDRPSPNNPLRIVELGSGLGKFSFLFLKQLSALLKAQDLPPNLVRYCMTDCSERLVADWRSNSFLSPFVECGMLQFAVLDVSEPIHLQFLTGEGSGQPENCHGPLVVIANYCFDSLAQDVFRIKDGQVFERLQTLRRPPEGSERDAGQALSRLEFEYQDVSVDGNRYQDPTWNRILGMYRAEIPSATVLFPVQVLRTLQAIRELSGSALLVLASDKGYLRTENMSQSQDEPKFEFHSANCFSAMVNFDAIARYFELAGGAALLPAKHNSTLHTCAFLEGPTGQFPTLVRTYSELRMALGPDDLFGLLGWLNAHMEELTVSQALSVLRLTRWDPITFLRLFPVLARQVRNAGAEREDLQEAIARTWENQFPVTSTDHALAFYCGVLLLELRFFREAYAMFRRSQIALGPSAATSYNLGLCSIGLDRSAEAHGFMADACELDCTFEPAQRARQKLEEQQSSS
ncbi:MAG TPA: SAM-dependent methyltransferase [Candidatus Saccharimonadales bacterium]|nr:SAM-dependent methyltransferase [Candidatus Saccharimonadales bacterium]